MANTPNLALPYLLAAQAQKHVTVNESLRALDALVMLSVLDKDSGTPPGTPTDGQRWIVGAAPTGAWAGQTGKIAAWQDGAWIFYTPREGWLSWVADEDLLYAYNGSAWNVVSGGGGGGGVTDGDKGDITVSGGGTTWTIDAAAVTFAKMQNVAQDTLVGRVSAGTGSPAALTKAQVGTMLANSAFTMLGINATADATNRLAVSSAATLFNNAGAGHQIKVNKAAAGDTASFLFQTGFSGRAEFGTTGDDDFHFKVSPDGSAWHDSFTLNSVTGEAQFNQPIALQQYSKAALPSTTASGRLIYVWDATGGAAVAYCDGGNWRRIADGTVIN
jgi:hypothetical protein